VILSYKMPSNMHQMRSWFCTFLWWGERNRYAEDQLRTLTTDASSVTNLSAAEHIERITARQV